jgi:hypothetical protein
MMDGEPASLLHANDLTPKITAVFIPGLFLQQNSRILKRIPRTRTHSGPAASRAAPANQRTCPAC